MEKLQMLPGTSLPEEPLRPAEEEEEWRWGGAV